MNFINRIIKKGAAFNQRYIVFVQNAANPKTIKELLVSLSIFAFFLAYAWNLHIFGPWVDIQFGWGPHDVDSAEEIQWRRIWVSLICIPGAIAATAIYFRNRRK